MEKYAGQTYLRIKLKHLALEPALVKLEMVRARRRAHYKALASAGDGGNTPPYTDPWLAVSLRSHRLTVIRPEARAAQVAYAYLRGKSYTKTEGTSKRPPDWRRVAELALKYGDFPSGTTKVEAQNAVIAWAQSSLVQAHPEAA